jgi:hypothetical protein
MKVAAPRKAAGAAKKQKQATPKQPPTDEHESDASTAVTSVPQADAPQTQYRRIDEFMTPVRRIGGIGGSTVDVSSATSEAAPSIAADVHTVLSEALADVPMQPAPALSTTNGQSNILEARDDQAPAASMKDVIVQGVEAGRADEFLESEVGAQLTEENMAKFDRVMGHMLNREARAEC